MANYFKALNFLLVHILFLVFSCQGIEEESIIQITISPSATSISTQTSFQFSVQVTGTENKDVIWSIKEGSAGGSINSEGLYVAPNHVGTYTIEVMSVADKTKMSTATVTVTEEPQVSISITPITCTTTTGGKVQFTATVSNTTNTSIAWKVNEGITGGTISNSGLYTAPNIAGKFHITATSQSDPTKTASAEITVTATTATNPEKEAAIKLYNDLYLASALTNVGWNGNTSTCDPGTTPKSTKDKVVQRIMYYRTMVGLKSAISENPTKSAKCQQTALMCKANGALNHNPPTTWLCYTTEGKEAAGKSNLASGNSGPNAVSAYIRDDGSNNYFVGHRRWLLFPKLKEVGTGDTNNTNALWVIGDNGPTPTDMPEFIAWPPKGYVPATVVYPRWSFSVPSADFNNTSITMKDPTGNDVTIVMENLNNGGYGDRTIVWKPQGVILNSSSDQIYKVYVNNVKVGTQVKNYQYDVIIIKP